MYYLEGKEKESGRMLNKQVDIFKLLLDLKEMVDMTTTQDKGKQGGTAQEQGSMSSIFDILGRMNGYGTQTEPTVNHQGDTNSKNGEDVKVFTKEKVKLYITQNLYNPEMREFIKHLAEIIEQEEKQETKSKKQEVKKVNQIIEDLQQDTTFAYTEWLQNPLYEEIYAPYVQKKISEKMQEYGVSKKPEELEAFYKLILEGLQESK